MVAVKPRVRSLRVHPTVKQGVECVVAPQERVHSRHARKRNCRGPQREQPHNDPDQECVFDQRVDAQEQNVQPMTARRTLARVERAASNAMRRGATRSRGCTIRSGARRKSQGGARGSCFFFLSTTIFFKISPRGSQKVFVPVHTKRGKMSRREAEIARCALGNGTIHQASFDSGRVPDALDMTHKVHEEEVVNQQNTGTLASGRDGVPFLAGTSTTRPDGSVLPDAFGVLGQAGQSQSVSGRHSIHVRSSGAALVRRAAGSLRQAATLARRDH